MADEINYKIIGNDLQLVEIELDPGEGVRAEAGTMTYMDSEIVMNTSTGGGMIQGLKRSITGESFFITTFTNNGNKKSKVGFAAPYPGKIIPLELGELGGHFLCQKDSFLCAAMGVNIEVALTKRMGAGLFGGEGFILQRLEGDGIAFVHAGGTLIERDLSQGETLRVDTGCLLAFSPTIDYDIKFVGGVRNVLFGGEGFFFTNLTGPGKIYLQSLPFSRLADRIIKASKANRGEKSR